LQTRTGKRTGAAAVRIAIEMVEEGLIDQREAVLRVDPGLIDQLLHPMIDPEAEVTVLATGLPASPGAASGRVLFDPDDAEAQAGSGDPIVLVRHETSPDDFHGMAAASAILTARGGMTSHAAVVARGMGKPCIVGADDITLNYDESILQIGQHTIRRGDWLTVDGSTGRVLYGQVPTVEPELGDQFQKLMGWADSYRQLRVRANVDNGHDAEIARGLGAEGIGLCRTEHMFMGDERLEIVREMILADTAAGREDALDRLLPIQRGDFFAIFRAMHGLPVTIRLLDPPLHEFLPDQQTLMAEMAELKLQVQRAGSMAEIDQILKQIFDKETFVRQNERIREVNPMLGHRGCRVGIVYPEVTRMQVRAIMEAACQAHLEEIEVLPEIMIPLISTGAELKHQRAIAQEVAQQVLGEYGLDFPYQIGTMIELPRAALTAAQIAEHADFFSFGTNDLTQTTFGLSRDDSGRFLPHYISGGIFANDPFQVLDREGVGQLVHIGLERGRETKAGLKIGICGEHGGEPSSVAFCHEIGMDYVSCSPFRVPIARLAAAQAVLREEID
jgi:pyruvate,orthophosphate dikinase